MNLKNYYQLCFLMDILSLEEPLTIPPTFLYQSTSHGQSSYKGKKTTLNWLPNSSQAPTVALITITGLRFSKNTFKEQND